MSVFVGRFWSRMRQSMQLNTTMRDKKRQLFSVDVRSLALMRVCMAALLIADVCLRVVDLDAFYTDESFFFNELTFNAKITMPKYICLHRANSSAVFQLMMFATQFIAACAMLVGYRTQLATIISCVLLISLHGYVPIVLNGGDDVMRIFLVSCSLHRFIPAKLIPV